MPPPEQRVEPNTLLFTGKLDYRPNVDALCWFCTAVLPRVRIQHPAARLLVVGPGTRFRRCGALAGPGVEVVGEVPEIQPYFARAGGVRHSDADGAAVPASSCSKRGLPVSRWSPTTAGAAGTGPARADEHLLVADDPATLATQIGRLLVDPALGSTPRRGWPRARRPRATTGPSSGRSCWRAIASYARTSKRWERGVRQVRVGAQHAAPVIPAFAGIQIPSPLREGRGEGSRGASALTEGELWSFRW